MNTRISDLISDIDGDVYISIKLLDLCSHLIKNEVLVARNQDNLAKQYYCLFNSIWKISVVFDKVTLIHHWSLNKSIHELQAENFARTDIEYFHVVLRSSMDYVCDIVSNLLGVEFTKSSFSVVRKNLKQYTEVLPQELYQLIEKAEWYRAFSTTRNNLVHSGSEVRVTHTQNGTLFMLEAPPFDIGKAAIFEEYAHKHFSEYVCFLNEVGNILIDELPLQTIPQQLRISGQGIKVFKHWHTIAQGDI
jgi:hypothetical protein